MPNMVYWLWEETHVMKVVGSNPSTIYWMDNFSHCSVEKLYCLLVESAIINKRRPGKANLKNKKLLCSDA